MDGLKHKLPISIPVANPFRFPNHFKRITAQEYNKTQPQSATTKPNTFEIENMCEQNTLLQPMP